MTGLQQHRGQVATDNSTGNDLEEMAPAEAAVQAALGVLSRYTATFAQDILLDTSYTHNNMSSQGPVRCTSTRQRMHFFTFGTYLRVPACYKQVQHSISHSLACYIAAQFSRAQKAPY